jgi:hypothetical protein
MSRKRALIIGNIDYSRNPLTLSTNHAEAFADTLRQVNNCELDFQKNLKSDDMYKKINDFIMSIKPNDFVIFYFSGYASRWRDQNFLLPCDNDKIRTGNSMHHYGINAQVVVDDMADMNPQVVLFLFDCCRTYPPSKKTSTIMSSNQQIGDLSEMKAPDKAVIGFACAAAEASSNQSIFVHKGLFTKHLIQHIKIPKVSIATILNTVMNAVAEETNGTQRPFQSSSLIGEVFIVEDGKLIFLLANLFTTIFSLWKILLWIRLN